MLKVILLLFSPVIIIASGEAEIQFSHHSGTSGYSVKHDKLQLESQLDFPFTFKTIDAMYHYPIGSSTMTLSSSFLLFSNTETSQDYDWKKNQMTVFSTSQNHVDRYVDFGLGITRDITDNIELFNQFHYKTLDFYWQDTNQMDYVKDQTSYIADKSLEYQQTFYEYLLGVNYQFTFSKDVLFELSSSLSYRVATLTDRHILRGFYTVQHLRTFGYNVAFSGNYHVTDESSIVLALEYKRFADHSLNMNYYNQMDESYMILPSSYRFESTMIGVGYRFSF